MLAPDRTLFGGATGLSYADTPHGLFVVLVIQARKEGFSNELYPQTKSLFTHKVIF